LQASAPTLQPWGQAVSTKPEPSVQVLRVDPMHVFWPGLQVLQASLSVLQPLEQGVSVEADPSAAQTDSVLASLHDREPGWHTSQALRVALQLSGQVCRSRGWPSAPHSFRTLPLQ
jgi:hypothetical protein